MHRHPDGRYPTRTESVNCILVVPALGRDHDFLCPFVRKGQAYDNTTQLSHIETCEILWGKQIVRHEVDEHPELRGEIGAGRPQKTKYP